MMLALDLRGDPASVVDDVKPWAERLGATVDLVYVDEFRTAQPIANAAGEPALDREYERIQDEDSRELVKLRERLPLACRGQVVTAAGEASEPVTKMACDYELVALATSGRTGLAHFWLGSCAERVMRSCTTPILVLRLPAKG